MSKKVIDKNGRLFGKISVIDIAVLIIMIVLAISFYLKFNVIDETSTKTVTQPITYTVKIPAVRQYALDMLEEGDAFFSNDNGSKGQIGEITKIEYSPATFSSPALDGTYSTGTIEGKYDVVLTIKADASSSKGRFYVDSTFEIVSNASHNFNTKYYNFYGTILDVN